MNLQKSIIAISIAGIALFYQQFIGGELTMNYEVEPTMDGEVSVHFEVDSLEERAKKEPEYFPTIVNEVPQGFISLNTALETSLKLVNTLFFETNFVIQNLDGVTIFQTNVKNSNFIIIYNNEYYINEKEFLKIVD